MRATAWKPFQHAQWVTPVKGTSDRHREMVTSYLAALVRRFGFERVEAHTGQLARIVWSPRGFNMLEMRVTEHAVYTHKPTVREIYDACPVVENPFRNFKP